MARAKLRRAGAALLLAVVLPLALSTAARPAAAQTQQATVGEQHTQPTFQNLNGFMWFYNTYFGYKYKDITRQLDHFKADGIRVLGFFSPYHGDRNQCDGCDPLDFYSVSPQNGTIQDWRDLVKAAHERGMKVVGYFVNIYMDENAPFFKTAQEQYARGDRTSREVSAIRWTTNPADPLPPLQMPPNPGVSHWEWSPIAGAYYWKLWFGPGFDWSLPSSVAEVTRIEKFWLDTGIDGFMWDVGTTNSLFKPYAVDLPKTYTSNDKWLTFERASASNAAVYKDFGLTSWFNYQDNDIVANDYTRVVNGEIDANGLETALKGSDYARSVGTTTYAWSISADDPDANLIPHSYPSYPNDEVMRVQEAALLAGAGILYGGFMYDQYLHWSPTLRANWDRVLRTVNDNKALLPSANRVRVPAGSDPDVYAMRRTSQDGKQTALLVYNFHNTATNVTVDLTGAGIKTKQQPKDLYNGGKAAPIHGTSYTVSLPAYGFTMLQVKTN